MQEQSHVAHPSIERSRLEEKGQRTNIAGQQTALRPSSRSATKFVRYVCRHKRYRHAMCFKRQSAHTVHRSAHRTSPRRSCRHRRPRQPPPVWRRYRPWLRFARLKMRRKRGSPAEPARPPPCRLWRGRLCTDTYCRPTYVICVIGVVVIVSTRTRDVGPTGMYGSMSCVLQSR